MFGLDIEIDLIFVAKFAGCFFVFVIFPVWIFTLIELSLLYKCMFTLAGGVGVFMALGGKTLKGFSGRNRG